MKINVDVDEVSCGLIDLGLPPSGPVIFMQEGLVKHILYGNTRLLRGK